MRTENEGFLVCSIYLLPVIYGATLVFGIYFLASRYSNKECIIPIYPYAGMACTKMKGCPRCYDCIVNSTLSCCNFPCEGPNNYCPSAHTLRPNAYCDDEIQKFNLHRLQVGIPLLLWPFGLCFLFCFGAVCSYYCVKVKNLCYKKQEQTNAEIMMPAAAVELSQQ